MARHGAALAELGSGIWLRQKQVREMLAAGGDERERAENERRAAFLERAIEDNRRSRPAAAEQAEAIIELQVARGMALRDAVIASAAVRAQPIALTGLAAMTGALFILDDPIFNGLAVSLIFGIAVSTMLTLVVIPVLYYAVYRKRYEGASVAA